MTLGAVAEESAVVVTKESSSILIIRLHEFAVTASALGAAKCCMIRRDSAGLKPEEHLMEVVAVVAICGVVAIVAIVHRVNFSLSARKESVDFKLDTEAVKRGRDA